MEFYPVGEIEMPKIKPEEKQAYDISLCVGAQVRDCSRADFDVVKFGY